MTALVNDPDTRLSTRVGLYLFFMGHMAVFGTLTFYISYNQQIGDIYSVGFIATLIYVIFFLMMFGVDEVLWLVITCAMGVFMIDGWLEFLAAPFMPTPVAGRDMIITDFNQLPTSHHIFPGAFLLMYEFLLRNLLIDLTGARHNERRKRIAGVLFIVVSGVQIYLASVAA